MEGTMLVCKHDLNYFTYGRGYKVLNTNEDGDYLITDDEGDKVWLDGNIVKHCFRVIYFTEC